MKHICTPAKTGVLAAAALFLFGAVLPAPAQVLISSVVPPDGATGVSVSSTVVFTFNQPMNPNMTFAMFTDESTQNIVGMAQTWSADDTVLTYTPYPSMPSNTQISWSFIIGTGANGESLSGTTSGSFSTGGSSTGGSGTNAITTFVAGKGYNYHQTSAAAPVSDATGPYFFQAVVSLASNRTATAVNLTLPNSAVSNLTQNFFAHEDWMLNYFTNDESVFNNTWPSGAYTFNIQSTTNQSVTVNFPTTMLQPNAPHVTNYTAAQAVDASQAFTLGWDAFQGGTGSDYIYVQVEDVWHSPEPPNTGVLDGSVRSVQIPAGTLQAGSNYTVAIGFYRYLFATNAGYTASSYKATMTDLNLTTLGSTAPSLVFTNFAYSAGAFSFDLDCAIGQVLTIEFATNLTTAPWLSLVTTNPTVSRIHITDPRATTNRSLLYRARTGS